MILFARDWQRYPTAIADLQTKNTSFVRLAQLYKSMGVKNHTFLLALLQPELQGVDPHDPNLSMELKLKIGIECRENPWYFFREVVRIPPQSGPVAGPLRANRGNIAVIWTFLNNVDCACIQPRQTGKSVSTDCLMAWLIYIGSSNTTITMITKDNDLRKKNVERLKKIRNLLPTYLYTLMSDDADNQVELTCKTLDNSYMTGVAQNSEASASNVGRGLTSPVLHCDEGPFISFINATLPAALAAGTAARDEAKRNNRPYGNIFTTTAGKKDDRDGKYMYLMIFGGAVWTESFFDCENKKDFHEMVKLNGSGRKQMVNITMSHRQLGYTDEWLYDAISNINGSPEQIERDMLNIWTAGSLRSPLTVQLLEAIANSDIDVLHNEISPDRYILRWYFPEAEIARRMSEGQFIMGLDTSDAVGRDTIAMVIVDASDLSVVAAGTYNETNLIRFANYLANLLIKYPTMTLVIERKSTAAMIVDYLLLKLPAMGQDPFRRIFNKVVDEAGEKKEEFNELTRSLAVRSEEFYTTRKGKFGFVTNQDNRNVLFTTVLQNAAKQSADKIRDRTLSQEIRSLVEKNGRIDHAAGGHDDMVIAWLLTHWFLTHGRNLSHYGIDANRVMRTVAEMGRTLTEEQLEERQRQADYAAEVDEILEALKNTSNEMAIAKYEHRLRHLASRSTNFVGDDAVSIDALLMAAAEERTKQQRLTVRRNQSGFQQQYRNRPVILDG